MQSEQSPKSVIQTKEDSLNHRLDGLNGDTGSKIVQSDDPCKKIPSAMKRLGRGTEPVNGKLFGLGVLKPPGK